MALLRYAALPLLFAASTMAADLKQTLALIDKSAASFKALSADFRQLDHFDQIKTDEVSSASLLARKNKSKDFSALLTFKEPSKDRWSLNGRKGRHYLPKLNVLEEYDLDKKMGSILNQYLLLGFGTSSADLQAGYKVEMGGPDTINGQKATRLQLTPRKKDALNLTRVDMWVSDETGITLQLKLFENGGDYKLLTYSNIKLLPELSDTALDIKAPKDAKVEHPLK